MKCKACDKEIVFLPTAAGKKIPVNGSSLSEDDIKKLANRETVMFDHTRHISHFADCPAASTFRKPKEEEPRLL